MFPGEETEIKHAITSLDQQEDAKKTWKDQVLLYADSLTC